MITPELIARINALAKKKKAQGLTAAEQEEQAQLRRIYLDHIRGQLHDTLSRIHIVEKEAEAELEEIETPKAPQKRPGEVH